MWGWLEKTLTWLGVNAADAKVEVVSTEIFIDPVEQTDGSRWVREVHTLDNGEVRVFQYLCDQADDPEEIAAGRASVINAEMAAAEPSAEPTDAYLG